MVDSEITVTVMSGFLGSGKTTLWNTSWTAKTLYSSYSDRNNGYSVRCMQD